MPKFIITRRIIDYELDGYCAELNVAFEYQGRQHYEHIEFFQPNEEAFKRRLEIDAIKRIRCKLENISLVEVPYTESKTNNSLIQFIYNKLVALNIPIVKKPEEISLIDINGLIKKVSQ